MLLPSAPTAGDFDGGDARALVVKRHLAAQPTGGGLKAGGADARGIQDEALKAPSTSHGALLPLPGCIAGGRSRRAAGHCQQRQQQGRREQ